jgi:aspartyl-tRNA(Asn)/glutamyl-tRNA(Gln) amidotransferase subunit C
MTKKYSLSKEEILHLAKLAKLSLNNQEIAKYQAQLGETIEYIKNLNQLDTDKVVPSHSVVNLKNITFVDGEKNKRALSCNQALANSKKKKFPLFIVDRLISS